MYLRSHRRPPKTRGISFKRVLANLALVLAIVAAVAAIQLREQLATQANAWAERNLRFSVRQATPVPTIPAGDLQLRYVTYMEAGNMKNAISALASLSETRPNDLRIHVDLTKMLLFRDDSPTARKQALEAAQRALNASPETVQGWVIVAMALNANDNPQAALPYLLRARDFDSQDPNMLIVLADTYYNLEDFERAATTVDQGIELAKAKNPIDISMLAFAYVVKGKIEGREDGQRAVINFQEAWRIAQTDPEKMPAGYIAQWLWSYYFNSNDYQQVIEVLTQATVRDKDDPINAYLLGRTYLKAGDNTKATTFLERCLDLDPNQVKCLRWLATMMFRADNRQRAAELGKRAVEIGTDDAGAYLVAGSALAYTNRCGEAVPILQKGQQLAFSNSQFEGLLPQFNDALRACGLSGAAPPPNSTPGQ
jgi:tetratricopeptide (TPR) repeat protein